MPECTTALAMAVIYLCHSPKSNAVDQGRYYHLQQYIRVAILGLLNSSTSSVCVLGSDGAVKRASEREALPVSGETVFVWHYIHDRQATAAEVRSFFLS